MQSNELTVEQFNKIYELNEEQNPAVFSQLLVSQLEDYAPNVLCFTGQNLNNGQQTQIYLSNLKIRDTLPNLNRIIYLKDSPNIVLAQAHSQTLIIEQKIYGRLSSDLEKQQASQGAPYFEQTRARNIIMQLTRSLDDFKSQQIQYDCISPKNVVLDQGGVAHFSLVGYLLRVDQNNPLYWRPNAKDNQAYSMACLFFKLLYGFAPNSGDPTTPTSFDPEDYLAELKCHSHQKLLKIFYYCQRSLFVSPHCQQFLKKFLTAKMTWQDWLQDEYFGQGFEQQHKLSQSCQVNQQNKLIKMVSRAKISNSSIIMSAINYRQAHPFEKLNSRPVSSLEQLTFEEAYQCLKKYRAFSQISRAGNGNNMKVQAKDQDSSIINMGYFKRASFDTSQDNPCLNLIEFIQAITNRCSSEQEKRTLQKQLKLYGYPYAVAFELLKVKKDQPSPIQTKIDHAVDLLLQVSAFHQVQGVQPLPNPVSPAFNSFSQLKPKYRASINELYHHFLNEAMKKYNSETKNEGTKKIGLSYYRLCLKLLQASLIVRKGGSDLNLERIEYSSRKQVQDDLTELLEKYFRQRPEIH